MGRGVGSTLRLDILSVDGTIIWEEMGAAVEGDVLAQAFVDVGVQGWN